MAGFMECKDACSQSEKSQNTCPTPESSVFKNNILFFTNNFSKAWKIILFKKIYMQKNFWSINS